jgi:hypothetical protein
MRVSFIGLRPLALCVVALGFAHGAAAQPTPAVEVSGGYQSLHATEGEGFSIPVGWHGDVAFNVNANPKLVVGLVGQVTGSYKSEAASFANDGIEFNTSANIGLHQFMGGVRFSDRQKRRAVWFLHLLGGAIRSSVSGDGSIIEEGETLTVSIDEAQTLGGLQLGGGIDLHFTDRAGVRLGADVIRLFHEDEATNIFRLTTGLVFSFGEK